VGHRTETVRPGEETSAATVSRLTDPGAVIGTVGYLSPEQVRGEIVDHRSDLLSFGAVLYELLTARQAFRHGSAAETMAAILNEDPPEMEETGRPVPPGPKPIVEHCLEKSAARRFHDAEDLAFALGFLAGRTGRPEPAAGPRREHSDPLRERDGPAGGGAGNVESQPRIRVLNGSLEGCPLVGELPRTISEGVLDAAWNADGRLAEVRAEEKGTRIELPEERAIARLPQGRFGGVRFSPDGKHLGSWAGGGRGRPSSSRIGEQSRAASESGRRRRGRVLTP
jgi:hypothetical protein